MRYARTRSLRNILSNQTKGRLKEIIHQQMGGLRSCMGLTGCGTIDLLRTKAEFVRISGAGIQESHVHDVTITKEPPNYRA